MYFKFLIFVISLVSLPTSFAQLQKKFFVGQKNTCVVNGDTLKCVGDNTYGQLKTPTDLSEISDVAIGDGHICALDRDGVWCWGLNDKGQLHVTPNLHHITAISASNKTTCALEQTGTVSCWGNNQHRQLDVPQNMGEIVQVSVFYSSVCAINSNSQIYCWGGSSYHLPPNHPIAERVSTGESDHFCTLTAYKVNCWGTNNYNQINVPPNLGRVKDIVTGYGFSCALNDQNTLKCWGQLSPIATEVHDIAEIKAGGYFIYSRNTNAQDKFWGRNFYGELYLDLGEIVSASSVYSNNGYTTCIVNSQGDVKCWGYDLLIQAVPENLAKATKISLGLSYACIVTTEAFVKCWGDNSNGILNVPEDLSLVIKISAQAASIYALTSDGKIVSWGYDTIKVPSSFGFVVDFQTNHNSICAKNKMGIEKCWLHD